MRLGVSKEDAERVLRHPEIYETIAEDGAEEWKMPDGPIYLCGYNPDLLGCFVLHKINHVTWECHVQVLPEWRDHSMEFGIKMIEWAWENTDAMKLVAQIPLIYPNVMDFAVKQGFEQEGVNKASIMKNGELFDQWYVGLRRP